MKTMCPPGYHHNGFVATHALGHTMYTGARNLTSCAQVHELPQSHCGDSREGTLFFYIIYIKDIYAPYYTSSLLRQFLIISVNFKKFDDFCG